MLYMKEMRPVVQSECTLKESAAINQILGRRVSKNINLLLTFIYLITYSIFCLISKLHFFISMVHIKLFYLPTSFVRNHE